MADYVSSLTGVAMDMALQDMAEHNSEAWAVGERNGIPVGSDDVTYQNNAQYYAQQAQSIAPASVTEAVRWDIAQTALTDANKAQARSNIDAGKNGAWSNPNLLDNAYFVGGGSQLGDGVFPINQRGLTSYTNTTYIVDRWRMWANTSTVTLTASGLTFATGANSDGLFQYSPQGKIESLYGLTVTASLLLTDGTLYTATGVADAACWIATDINGGYFGYTNGYFRVNLDANKSISIKAVKLEEGTVSTLANDPPPKFGAELRECQRYLRYVPFTRSLFALESAYSIALKTLEGIEMASFPTAALVQAGTVIQLSNPPAYATPTGASVIANYYSTPTVQIGLSAALEGVGYVTETVISLSCEL